MAFPSHPPVDGVDPRQQETNHSLRPFVPASLRPHSLDEDDNDDDIPVGLLPASLDLDEVFSSPNHLTVEYNPQSSSRETYTTQATQHDSPTPACFPQRPREPSRYSHNFTTPYAHNQGYDHVFDQLKPVNATAVDPANLMYINARGVLVPVIQDDDVPELNIGAPLITPPGARHCNTLFPPYNPLGPLAFQAPSAREEYVLITNPSSREYLFKRANLHRKYIVPDKHQNLHRAHAEAPTTDVFCEYEEGHELRLDYINLHGREPEWFTEIHCAQDWVLGLLIRWKTVEDATWFLYYHKTEGLLVPGPYDRRMALPPRFVDARNGFRYHNTPMINLNAVYDPVLPQYDAATQKLLSDWKLFDINMFKIDRQRWLGTPEEWRDSKWDFNRLPPPSSSRPRSPRGGQNAISAAKIRDGLDVRTTAMVRNLPNQVTFDEVKKLLDTFCPGLYDFLYLRADFKTGNNVGYFFVNFHTAIALLRFLLSVENFAMPGWESSAKRTKLAYADCQGVDSLIDRFRNSAIMNEPYDRRPHLYWTVDDGAEYPGLSVVGKERPFPPPNNLTRLGRSVARTQVEGLFAGGARGGRRGGTTSPAESSAAAELQELRQVLALYETSMRRGALLAWIRKGGF